MPGASIRIDQVRPGPVTSTGVAGVARDDLWLSSLVNLVSTAGPNTDQQWTLLDKPEGSTAVLATDTAATASFTPDLIGSYRVQLTTNGGGQSQILIAAVTKDAAGSLLLHGWRVPAFREKGVEANFAGNSKGWKAALATIIGGIDAVIAAAITAEETAVKTFTNKTLGAPVVTGTVVYQGTKLRILSIPGEAATAAITTVVIAQFTILDETSVRLDFTASMKATGVNAKSGGFAGSATYMRSAGGAPSLVGAATYATQQRTVAGDDVTFSVTGNIVRVLASAADVDGRNWTCEFRVAETLAT